MNREKFKSGFVSIVGAPNAGKSTFLNRILKFKVAIVTEKPQTTRHRILGVQTTDNYQAIFWDTPGLHKAKESELLNQTMVAQAKKALSEGDLILWIIDGFNRGQEHAVTAQLIKDRVSKEKLLIAVNKCDLVEGDENQRLIDFFAKEYPALAVHKISSQTGAGIKKLLKSIEKHLPLGPLLYPADTVTDQAERSIAAEMIRAAVFCNTNQELPYSTAVMIDEFTEKENIIHLKATIHVEKESQKPIIIGRGGKRLKKIATVARKDIEHLTGKPIYLEVFVRVSKNWTKNPRDISEFGYSN